MSKQYKVIGGYSEEGFDFHVFPIGTIVTLVDGTEEDDEYDGPVADFIGPSPFNPNGTFCQFIKMADVEEVTQ